MIRIWEYEDSQYKFNACPTEKEFSCPACCKPLKFRGRSPFRCEACQEPMVDISGLMEDLETRISYHRFGEISVIHDQIFYTSAR